MTTTLDTESPQHLHSNIERWARHPLRARAWPGEILLVRADDGREAVAAPVDCFPRAGDRLRVDSRWLTLGKHIARHGSSHVWFEVAR